MLGGPQVLFARWSQAEAAADSLDGVSLPQAGGAVGRPLVVHFANPRRAPPGQPAEPGVAPRKLFVGQARQGTRAAAVVSAGGWSTSVHCCRIAAALLRSLPCFACRDRQTSSLLWCWRCSGRAHTMWCAATCSTRCGRSTAALPACCAVADAAPAAPRLQRVPLMFWYTGGRCRATCQRTRCARSLSPMARLSTSTSCARTAAKVRVRGVALHVQPCFPLICGLSARALLLRVCLWAPCLLCFGARFARAQRAFCLALRCGIAYAMFTRETPVAPSSFRASLPCKPLRHCSASRGGATRAGCAFVQFRKWCQAEAAMEAHNGKTRMGNSEVPLVVKFADAKRKDCGAGQASPAALVLRCCVARSRCHRWPFCRASVPRDCLACWGCRAALRCARPSVPLVCEWDVSRARR